MTFPSRIRKLVCIGRNFADHAKELGNKVPTVPFFFLKPSSSLLVDRGNIEVPKGCNVHHEGMRIMIAFNSYNQSIPIIIRIILLLPYFIIKVELGVVIGKEGRDIQEAEAMSHIAGTWNNSSPHSLTLSLS